MRPEICGQNIFDIDISSDTAVVKEGEPRETVLVWGLFCCFSRQTLGREQRVDRSIVLCCPWRCYK